MVDELRVRMMLDRLGVEIDALHRLATRDPMELLGDDDLLARFRNLLVHGYAKVDDTRVVEILRDRVDDLTAFRTALARAAGG